MLVAKLRHTKPEKVRRYFTTSAQATRYLTSR